MWKLAKQLILFFVLVFISGLSLKSEAVIVFDSTIEGGNGTNFFESPANTINVTNEADPYPANSAWGDWFSFKLTNVINKTLAVRIDFSNNRNGGSYESRAVQSIHPYYSYNGINWSYVTNISWSEPFKIFTVPNSGSATGNIMYIAYAVPYTYSDLQADINAWQTTGAISLNESLGYSSGGRNMHYLSVGTGQLEMAITCRAHPREQNASYYLKGIMDFLTSNEPQAVSLRQQTTVHVFPMLNPDGVYAGRNRSLNNGEDCNRDFDTTGPDPIDEEDETFLVHQQYSRIEADLMMHLDIHAGWDDSMKLFRAPGTFTPGLESAIEELIPIYDILDLWPTSLIDKPNDGLSLNTTWREGLYVQYGMPVLLVEGGYFRSGTTGYINVEEQKNLGKSLIQSILEGMIDYEAGIQPSCSLSSMFNKTNLAVGIEYYTDRDYELTTVPVTYRGMEMIKTPNDDRNLTTASNYITFEMSDDGIVYVAYDSRAISEPNWMNGFVNTGDIIETSLATQPSLKIYSKNYNTGDCVNFGANKAPGFSGDTVSNYIVFYDEGVQPPACTLDHKFETTTISENMTYYTDRDYRIASVPDTYLGMNAIKTPNDERNLTTADHYLTFELLENAAVYVAYDSRAISEPNWMNGFVDTSDIIETSLSSQPSLKIYSKDYDAGACVNFGANKAPGFSGNTISNYLVFYGVGGSVSCHLDNKFEETEMRVGISYYTDRNYTITGGIPDWMIGRTLIRTLNDEREDASSSGYVRFTNPVDWWVYVLFDSRSSSVPSWLNGWQLRSDIKIITSLGSQPHLKVYRKEFEANQCVDLGGNYGPGSSGEYRSNYVVVYGN